MTSLSNWRTSGDLINNSGCFKTNIGRIYNSNRIIQPRTNPEYTYNKEVESPSSGYNYSADIIDSYLDCSSYSLDRYETARSDFDIRLDDDDRGSLGRKHRKSDTPTDSSPKLTGQIKRSKKSKDAIGCEVSKMEGKEVGRQGGKLLQQQKNTSEMQINVELKNKSKPSAGKEIPERTNRKPLAIQEFTRRRLSENQIKLTPSSDQEITNSDGSNPPKVKSKECSNADIIPCIIQAPSPSKSKIKRPDSKKSGKTSPKTVNNSKEHPTRELVDIRKNSEMNHITLLNGKKISPPIHVQCSTQPDLIAPNVKHEEYENLPVVESATKNMKSKHDGRHPSTHKKLPSDTRKGSSRRNSSSTSLNRKSTSKRNSSSISLEGRKASSSKSLSRTNSRRRIDSKNASSSKNNSKNNKQNKTKHASKPSTPRTPTQEARITTASNLPPRTAHATPNHQRRHQSSHSVPASSQRLQNITGTPSALPRTVLQSVIPSLPLNPPSYNESEQGQNIDTPPYREKLHKHLDLLSFDPRYSMPVLRINKKLIKTHSKLEKSMWKFKEYNLLPLEINLWDVRQVDDRHLYNIIPELLGVETNREQQQIEHALYLSLLDETPNEPVQCSSSTTQATQSQVDIHSNPPDSHRFRVYQGA